MKPPQLIIKLFLFTLLFFKLHCIDVIAKESITDSLQQALKSTTNDTVKVKLYNRLAGRLSNNELQLSMLYAQKAIKLSIEINYLSGQALAYKNNGVIEEKYGNYPEAFEFYYQSLAIYKKIGNDRSAATIHRNIGIIHRIQKNYKLALDYYFKALKVFRAVKDTANISNIYNSINIVYYEQKDYNNSMLYLFKSLKTLKSTKNDFGIAICYNNLGELFTVLGADTIYHDSLSFKAKKMTNLYLPELNERIIGILPPGRNGMNHLALEFFIRALGTFEEQNNKWASTYPLVGIGSLYITLNKGNEALPFLLEAEQICKELRIKQELGIVYKRLAEVYKQLKKFENAYYYLNLHKTINDSIFNSENSQSIAQLESKHEFEKLENEKRLKDAELKLQKVESYRQRILLWIIAGSLVIVMGFGYFIVKANKQKQKANDLLELKNAEIEEKNLELQKLSIVASETDNSVVITDEMGEIQWVNEGFEKMTGYDMSEFKQTIGSTLIEGSSNPEFSQLLNECVKGKKSLVYESINETKKGNKYWVQSTLTPIVQEDGRLTNIVVIDTDITERKKAEDDLKSKNKEIENKNKKLWQTSLAVNEQKAIIEEKSKDILASIRYARNIQQAILPKIAEIQKHLPEVFVWYKPKDIVSGDFYWFVRKDESLIIAVVDCTGHGVPGAFMSMVGNDLLNQIIIERNVLDPAQILHSLNEGIVFSLKQATDQHSVRDGMDMGLCMINLNNNELIYSGAVRPLWLFNKNGKGTNFTEYKGSIYGIGGIQYRDKPVYKNHVISINKDDTFYIFSDGITDQFGGKRNKKFSKKRLSGFLFEIQKLKLEKQQSELEKVMLDWQGNFEQIDDITIMGIRF